MATKKANIFGLLDDDNKTMISQIDDDFVLRRQRRDDDSPIQQYQQSGRAIEKLSERNIQVHAHKLPSLAG